MTEIKPFIQCVDYWPTQIPPEKLKVYEEMIADGQIRKHSVIYNRRTGSTTVEYETIAPHEWILDRMREMAEEQQHDQPMQGM